MQQPVLNSVNEWMLRDRHNRNMLGIARLRPGVGLPQARQELKALAERMAIANADVSQGMSATLLTLAESPHGPQALLAGPLSILMGVSILVLLIVCVNVANLLMARAANREKEFTTRLALGSGRGRLIRQVLTETLLLTACSAVLGIAATPLLGQSLKLLTPPGPAKALITADAHPGLAVMAFTAGLCIFTALAAGLLPALQVSRLNLSSRLNNGGRSGSAGRSRNRLHSVLVTAEVALALVTLVGAGLFAHAFQQTMQVDPGFDPNGVLLSQFYLNTNGYDVQHRKEFCRRLAEQMAATPSVTDVAYSDGVPLGFEPSWWEELDIEGYPRHPGENMNIFRNVISPGYLPLMHIPIVEGRNFTEDDNETKDVRSMIVSEAFVKRFFAGRDPIGKKIQGWGDPFRVVGVAKDSKYHYLNEGATPYIYVPFRQIYRADMNLAFYVRGRGDLNNLLATLREKSHEIDPNVTVFDAAPLKEFIGASLYPQKIAASVMAVMGCIAILLAAVGLYSVMAFWVAQRTQEIGVRMALGAQPSHVLRMVVRRGMIVTMAGVAVGMACAIALARAVSGVSSTNSAMGVHSALLNRSAADLLIYAASAAFLCGVALLACWIPARRAASVNPTDALRTE
jgi:predicted permease